MFSLKLAVIDRKWATVTKFCSWFEFPDVEQANNFFGSIKAISQYDLKSFTLDTGSIQMISRQHCA